MKKTLLIFFLISTTFLLFASSPNKLFQQANKTYEKGNYEETVDSYLNVLKITGSNSALYFNLGNAYYKLGKLGEAVLYYQKAQQLSPRDSEIKQNLEIVRLHVKDKIVEPDPGFVFKIITNLHNFFSINELTVYTTTLYLLLCSAIIYRIYTKKVYTDMLITILIVILVFPTISLTVKIYEKEFITQGVVVQKEAEVYSGPGTDYQHTFTLHEGTDLIIEQTRGEWHEIKVGVNLKGWTKTTAVGTL